jgi:uncharacterized protein (TIGR00725 family)
MKADRPAMITVIGGGSCGRETAELAFRVGAAVAERGAVVVCGGLGGVMEAACRGAIGAGGLTVGVLPGENVDDANEFVSVPIATGMGHARNVINVRTGSAVVALAGACGTLSEIALALAMGIPVVAVGAWSDIDGVHVVDDPEQAVMLAISLAGRS